MSNKSVAIHKIVCDNELWIADTVLAAPRRPESVHTSSDSFCFRSFTFIAREKSLNCRCLAVNLESIAFKNIQSSPQKTDKTVEPWNRRPPQQRSIEPSKRFYRSPNWPPKRFIWNPIQRAFRTPDRVLSNLSHRTPSPFRLHSPQTEGLEKICKVWRQGVRDLQGFYPCDFLCFVFLGLCLSQYWEQPTHCGMTD